MEKDILEKITTATEAEEGNLRKFSFSDKLHEVKEIIHNPNISMQWKWTTGICPYCKRRIERIITHYFYRIEILFPYREEENLKNIIIVGDTLDRRKMFIPPDDNAFKYTLLKSRKYKKLLKEVIDGNQLSNESGFLHNKGR